MEKNEKFIFSRIFCIIFKIRKIRRATNGLFKCELGNMIRKLLQVENHTISKQAVRQITMLDRKRSDYLSIIVYPDCKCRN